MWCRIIWDKYIKISNIEYGHPGNSAGNLFRMVRKTVAFLKVFLIVTNDTIQRDETIGMKFGHLESPGWFGGFPEFWGGRILLKKNALLMITYPPWN